MVNKQIVSCKIINATVGSLTLLRFELLLAHPYGSVHVCIL